MLYDITVYLYSQESLDGGETRYTYALEYKIHKNNGTFRNDIGEDQKTQYIVITDREGTLKIDAISTSKYK